MVGKPNFPPDVDKRKDLKGAAARPTPGLAALDQERAASMADEGGAAGAAVEAESEARRSTLDGDLTDEEEEEEEEEEDELPFARPVATFLLAGTVSALTYLLVRRLFR
jgi:hypothetical protein